MKVTPQPSVIWSYGDTTRVGFGTRLRIDPGTGPERYQRALGALRDSGSDVAFASFTFDPSVGGSVVVVPDSVSESPETLNVPNDQPGNNPRLESDGTIAWQEGLETALNALNHGAIEKVVLTRQLTFRLGVEPSISAIASALRSHQSNCYIFAVDGLVGASPELLVSHRDGVISSLVLAGTAPNAESLGSAKMDLEHVLAASSVRDGLSEFVSALATPSRTILEFGDIKHLATRFEGRATNGSTVLDVLGNLHPTASVGGTPKAAALDLIRKIEPTPRGRYAGPVGWFNTAGEGEFAIALRCGLIEENKVTLYSGGGLVQGSEPTSEFAETELKLQPMLQALGVK